MIDVINAPLDDDAYEELIKGLTIDPIKLHKALVQRPQLVELVGESANFWNKELQKVEFAYKKLQAQIDLDLREQIASSGDKKPTEAAIANTIQVDPRIEAFYMQVINIQFEKNKWFNLKQSFDAQGDSLKNLTGLVQIGYSII